MALAFAGLHPELRPYASLAMEWANYYGIRPEVTSVYRSWEKQQELYNRYLRGASQFPANPPGQSAHNYGLAWDSWVPDEHRAAWIEIRRAIGWYVPDNDWVHAGLPSWRSYVSFPT